MGDQKFQRKKYSTPRHPWEKDRIDAERQLLIKYGLKNKRELWRAQTILTNFRTQARTLQAKLRYNDPLAIKQFQLLIGKLSRLNLLGENATLDDVLSLNIEDILERRLETLVYKKNLALTMKQARQFITHGHIKVNDRVVTIPSFMVEKSMEDSITYNETSPFTDENHPLRMEMSGTKEEENE
ncbi:30S ribosomal protein S4 [Picrophilus oshimae]|uniref:Small ribosomal subunit protein uS4 n=2 Tax=Picrophilus torridus (strain ATCC 700027 / DSM 9790 / JCM 10055 / NBRC 100828 / KAW 2/3) TaxID=1122961 RepID=RS4_PICTO|nr:30S ribosomal protein S4 [Picrophilus oshimae]Q6KZP7.1 RecName: Full=Small ribosomal subunit protein uS4; AltName: Full=30S ribosomal protein S4 [Picrophilus oshimae DSM 9789]AAT43805.1 small subunit ribosomal protein S4P [Picrophilus oshimae DSM 9789]SMD31127.1 SSU ribosomal protein S4P [Picrophilus oshimae DSM 9789]